MAIIRGKDTNLYLWGHIHKKTNKMRWNLLAFLSPSSTTKKTLKKAIKKSLFERLTDNRNDLGISNQPKTGNNLVSCYRKLKHLLLIVKMFIFI